MALDAAIGIGEETAYGTPAATTTGYEGKADSWKVAREFIESVGFRRGQQTARADRRNIIDMGGEGELEVDLLDVGAAALLRAAFDKYSFTDTATHRVHVFETAPVSEAPSFTAQMIRPTAEGVNVAYKHVGCVATEWELTAEVENAVTLSVSFDFQAVSHTKAPVDFLPIDYPANGRPYDWSRTALTLTLAGVPVPVDAGKLSLTGDRGMKTDRRFLRANPLKKKPVRAAMPGYEGELEGEFTEDSLKLYESFLSGGVVALRADLTGLTPGTTLRFDCPTIQFTGESPEASPDDVTVHTLPFRVLDPGTGEPAIRATYTEPKPVAPLKATGTPDKG
ncbi:phage tail tube protein [Streptomyces tsukubensis]|uniref:phage tail tube protein n=1 Tax=Streptomyces tsukubensis TaxID=83656 RepID=UPI0036AF4666